MDIKNTTLEVAGLLKEKGILRLKDKEAIVAASLKDNGCLVVEIHKIRSNKGIHDSKARKVMFTIDRLKEAFGKDARWEDDPANEGEKLLVFAVDYPTVLGRVFSKVFDNPYGREIRFNGYHTTSLAEVRIGYDGKEPLTSVAAAISKIVKPYGFKAIAVEPYVWGTDPLNENTYNIKVVADNKERTKR